ncbi:MAG: cell division protein FtsA [Deltaproteobacteria bacterium]|nr:cell division protein FtsA [Deltaproteobacteria bacterium]
MKGRSDLIAGLDIGTSKIGCVVAEPTDAGLNILAVGSHPSKGMRKGVVINIETTVASIRRALEEAEIMSGARIAGVFAAVSGGHIKSFNSHGMIPLRGEEVTQKDVDRVLDAASAVAIPTDREILHVLPWEFIVDEQRGIRDPLGMNGVRLEVNCHIITGAVASSSNVVKCCNQVDLHVDGMVFEPLAASLAVLSEAERDMGAVVIDIGGGTSDIAVYHEGCLVHSAVLALGGGHVTNDIAHGLRLPAYPTAENLKKKYGAATAADIDPDDTVEINDGGRDPKWVARQVLCEIIEQRCDEILRLIHAELDAAGYLHVTRAGLVLTGGCALLGGIDRLAEQVFDTPARVGFPLGVTGRADLVRDPAFATAVGLVHFGRDELARGGGKPAKSSKIQNRWHRTKEWIKDFF